MNFLAHALLAGASSADRAGGVLGDFVKGRLDPVPAGLSHALAQGLILHRRIDRFADTHPAFLHSRARISPARRRVSGIMVDVFYDHFLARHWSLFSPQSLTDFAAETYALVSVHGRPLPSSFVPLFERMKAENWLVRYRETAYVADVLERMARYRLRAPNPLEGAGVELLADYAGFESDFFAFLPDARVFAAQVQAARHIPDTSENG